MGEALTIRVRREQGYAVVAVAGEVDIATVTRLRERLFELAASGRTLVVDLDQVSFIDSAGLAALVGAARRAAAHGASLQVVRPAPDPAAVPPDRAGRPGTAGPHPGRGTGVPGGGPARPPLASGVDCRRVAAPVELPEPARALSQPVHLVRQAVGEVIAAVQVSVLIAVGVFGGRSARCPQLAERRVQRVQVGIGHELVHPGG